jgi:GT2 family glycosyltransferase
VIIPVYNGAPFLERCLDALAGQRGATCRVIAVDNASTDGSAALIAARFPHVTLLRNRRNAGFSAACNQGLRLALAIGGWRLEAGDWRLEAGDGANIETVSNNRPPISNICMLLNQDTEVEEDWLASLLAAMEREPRAGAVGCKIFGYDGLLQHVGGELSAPRATTRLLGLGEADAGQHDTPAERAYVSGAAVALRAEALRDVGLFDERFSPAYMEEVDLCRRLALAGWKVLYEPQARVRHFEHGSPLTIVPRLRLLHRNRLRFAFKHYAADALLGRFWPAERRALATLVGGFDEPALHRAYLDALLALDTFLAARADVRQPQFSPAERHAAAAMLRELRDDLGRLRHFAAVTR